MISAILVIAVTSSIAIATDWQQFQKDKIAIGWTADSTLAVQKVTGQDE